jgi:hypothetical protein
MVSRFRKDKFEELIRLTEFFSWEELPIRDPETGLRTFAGLITDIQKTVKNIVTFTAVFHVVQTSIRIVISRDMVFEAWYPFDASRSPVYELILITQVNNSTAFRMLVESTYIKWNATDLQMINIFFSKYNCILSRYYANLSPLHAMRALGGSRDTPITIIDPRSRIRRVVSLTPRPIYCGR